MERTQKKTEILCSGSYKAQHCKYVLCSIPLERAHISLSSGGAMFCPYSQKIISGFEQTRYSHFGLYTVCPRSSDPFHIARYYKKWVTTSWTYSIQDASVVATHCAKQASPGVIVSDVTILNWLAGNQTP